MRWIKRLLFRLKCPANRKNGAGNSCSECEYHIREDAACALWQDLHFYE